MRIKTSLSVLLLLLLCSKSALAAFFSESLIYTGPPEFEAAYEESYGSPTSVSWTSTGKDMEVNARWWSVGGKVNNRWDSSHQSWSNLYASVEKEFQVTAAGAASISFSFNGSLQVSGTPNHNGDFYSYAQANIVDDTINTNAEVSWYFEINEVGSLDFSETATFDYIFDESDIGSKFIVWMWFDTEIGLPFFADDLVFTGDESLEFNSNLIDTLKIVNISGGISATDSGGPIPAVPIPAAAWLFGSGLLGLIGYSKRRKASL